MKSLLLLLCLGCRAPDAVGVTYNHGIAAGEGNNAARETSMTTDSDFVGGYLEWDIGARAKEKQEELDYLKAISEKPAILPTAPVLATPQEPLKAATEATPKKDDGQCNKKAPEPVKAPEPSTLSEPAKPSAGPPWWAVYIPIASTILLALIGLLHKTGHATFLNPKPAEPKA